MHQERERYRRQIILPGFGEAGQQKLARISVLVIGAGGLGCPVLQYLVAAGVGTIGIVDDDVVSVSNLHRQTLYTTLDVGMPKVEAAINRLSLINPAVKLIPYPLRLTAAYAERVMRMYDYVIDATDNFSTRYLVNDCCVLLGKPLIYGAVSAFEGQVAVFNAGDPEGRVNYRDLFPHPPAAGSIPNCTEGGVLGMLPGVIGCMQAVELIKLATGIGRPLIGQLLTYDLLSQQTFLINLRASPSTSSLIPANAAELAARDYDLECGVQTGGIGSMSADEFSEELQKPDVTIVDVREPGEHPLIDSFPHLQIPLSVFEEQRGQIDGNRVILFCQHGIRSQRAAALLQEISAPGRQIINLDGGIVEWYGR